MKRFYLLLITGNLLFISGCGDVQITVKNPLQSKQTATENKDDSEFSEELELQLDTSESQPTQHSLEQMEAEETSEIPTQGNLEKPTPALSQEDKQRSNNLWEQSKQTGEQVWTSSKEKTSQIWQKSKNASTELWNDGVAKSQEIWQESKQQSVQAWNKLEAATQESWQSSTEKADKFMKEMEKKYFDEESEAPNKQQLAADEI